MREDLIALNELTNSSVYNPVAKHIEEFANLNDLYIKKITIYYV